jgi:hypothetical protein
MSVRNSVNGSGSLAIKRRYAVSRPPHAFMFGSLEHCLGGNGFTAENTVLNLTTPKPQLV